MDIYSWLHTVRGSLRANESIYTIFHYLPGNAQGRYQAPNALPGHDKPFLLSPLWDGAPFTIIVPHSSELLFQSKYMQWIQSCFGIKLLFFNFYKVRTNQARFT